MTSASKLGAFAVARSDAPMRLDDLAREVPSAKVRGDGSVIVSGVKHDSRAVVAGDLFVARRGAASDGSKFIEDARHRGAVAVAVDDRVVAESLANAAIPVVQVDDSRVALAYGSAAIYRHPSFSLDVVGVTGTNGKTTTAHLLRGAIDASFGRAACGTIGTLGYTLGDRRELASHTTPEADDIARTMYAMRKLEATHVAMEVSSIALSLRRVDGVRFRVAAFTNFTQDHLDFHGSMEKYAEAKALLFTEHSPGVAVINIDDPVGLELAKKVRGPLVRVSTRRADADVVVSDLQEDKLGSTANVRALGKRFTLRTRLIGAHNIDNAAMTLAIGCALELDLERVSHWFENEAGAPGRMERCDVPADDIVVLVDYAHTPDALLRVLQSVRGRTKAAVLCVFGCGGDRDMTKRRPMGAVAVHADIVVITTDNARSETPEAIAQAIEEGVIAGGMSGITSRDDRRGYVIELDRRKAIEWAVLRALPGDLVVIAGKGHETVQITGSEARHFDDREVAREMLAARRARDAGGGS